MTFVLAGKDIASKIEDKLPGSIAAADGDYILVDSGSLLSVAAFLKETPDLGFNYLSFITAVDYYDYFLKNNTTYELHIKMPPTNGSSGSLSHHCERFRQNAVHRFSLFYPALEFQGLCR